MSKSSSFGKYAYKAVKERSTATGYTLVSPIYWLGTYVWGNKKYIHSRACRHTINAETHQCVLCKRIFLSLPKEDRNVNLEGWIRDPREDGCLGPLFGWRSNETKNNSHYTFKYFCYLYLDEDTLQLLVSFGRRAPKKLLVTGYIERYAYQHNEKEVFVNDPRYYISFRKVTLSLNKIAHSISTADMKSIKKILMERGEK